MEVKIEERILCNQLKEKVRSAEQAALVIQDGMTVATSGFTPSGYPKAVPLKLAERARRGEKIGITLITGASVGPEIDSELTAAGVIKRRFPYQTNGALRDAINKGCVEYADINLSQVAPMMKSGVFGRIDMAIVEAALIDEEGRIYPTTSVGIYNTAVALADKVIIEVNSAQPLGLVGMHDIYNIEMPPHTAAIPIHRPGDLIGKPYVECPPEKIAAIVLTDIPDKTNAMAPVDADSKAMANHIIEFLKNERAAGRLPESLLPLQSGVGSVANAVLSGLVNSGFKGLSLYSEVLQDSVLDLIDAGVVDFASATSFTISPERLNNFYEKLPERRKKMILRPQEISNHPEIIRRLGIIAMNTAIEADIYGNVNSTHVGGSRLMNGIGGSGDFTANAGLSIFTTASTAKNGTVSSIVPAVSHIDHTEHNVHVIITEQGTADLRGLGPVRRARAVIDNCAHPIFRPMLNAYLDQALQNSKYLHIPLYKV